MSADKKVTFVEPLKVTGSYILGMGRKTTEEEEALNDFALKLVMKIMDSVTSHFTAMKTPVGCLQRLTHGELTQETGLNHINGLLKMWNHNLHRVHYTEFQGIKDLGDSFLYLYCVYWSMPTAQIPVPKVETSMDFTIEFNKNKPPEAPVDIYYKMDHQSLILKPERTPLREKWLRDFLVAKHTLLESVPITRHAYDLKNVMLTPSAQINPEPLSANRTLCA